MTNIIKNEEGYYVQRRGERCVLYNPHDDPLCCVPMDCTDYPDSEMQRILDTLLPEEETHDN